MLKLIIRWCKLSDYILSILVYPAAILLKNIRLAGVEHLPRCKSKLQDLGVFPITNHYYEPLFDYRYMVNQLSPDRKLPGIDWNINEQISLLNRFSFTDELKDIPNEKVAEFTFHFSNALFDHGDAEYWYNIIRLMKPSKIIEIGSGYSTLMAKKAIDKNREEYSGYNCDLVCIEPYENLWLEVLGVNIIRKKLEDVDLHLFSELTQNNILFIDSSHIIRPNGDVLIEYLDILPSLDTGVIVHIHDIFSPKNYPYEWIVNQIRFWNEQYLLEAFLCHNRDWKIIGALNYLQHNYHELLKAKCPTIQPLTEPGSFYIQKVA